MRRTGSFGLGKSEILSPTARPALLNGPTSLVFKTAGCLLIPVIPQEHADPKVSTTNGQELSNRPRQAVKAQERLLLLRPRGMGNGL